MSGVKKKKRMGIKVDMTPMVDVAFLLLIFYMSTTQFKPPDKEVITLPESHSDLQVPEQGTITVNVNKDSGISIKYKAIDRSTNRPVTVEMPVPAAQLETELMKARQLQPTAFIVVRMDKDAKYGTMEDVMDVMRKTQTPRFNVLTEIEKS